MEDIEELVLLDIRSMAQLVIDDEKGARNAFLKKKEQQTAEQSAADNKRLTESKYRLNELSRLIQSVYEDKVIGKIPENVCVNLLEKYETEQRELTNIVAELEIKLSQMTKNEKDVDEFISRLKKYFDVETLTREMCLELIEYITVDEYQDYKPREIQIYYKFITEPLKDKRTLYSY
jgi:UvrD/REP helicase.